MNMWIITCVVKYLHIQYVSTSVQNLEQDLVNNSDLSTESNFCQNTEFPKLPGVGEDDNRGNVVHKFNPVEAVNHFLNRFPGKAFLQQTKIFVQSSGFREGNYYTQILISEI